MANKKIEEHLPMDVYELLAKVYGTDRAIEIYWDVVDGKLNADDVVQFVKRPDIDPEDWDKFEDGWRPDNW